MEPELIQAIENGKRMRLNAKTVWLLLHLDGFLKFDGKQYPTGVSRSTSLPYPDDLPGGKIGMATLNGLLKRGWAFEAISHGSKCGIYYITDEGREIAAKLKAIDAVKPPSGSRWTPATRTFLAAHGCEIKCPGCGTLAHTLNALHTCAGCGAPWRERGEKYEFRCAASKETSGCPI